MDFTCVSIEGNDYGYRNGAKEGGPMRASGPTVEREGWFTAREERRAKGRPYAMIGNIICGEKERSGLVQKKDKKENHRWRSGFLQKGYMKKEEFMNASI